MIRNTEIGVSAFTECENLTIRGYAGTLAESYALVYHIPFVAIDKENLTLGEIDGDGSISAGDAQKVLIAFSDQLMGNDTSLTAEQETAADIDGDGQLTALDAQYILMYYLYNDVLEIPVTWEQILP